MIGKKSFSRSGAVEIHIPDSVEELFELYFCDYKSLSGVTFDGSSSLKVVDKKAFQ